MNAFRQLRRHQHEHAEEHIHTLPAHHSSIVQRHDLAPMGQTGAICVETAAPNLPPVRRRL